MNRTINYPPLQTTDNEFLKELSLFSIYVNGSIKGILAALDNLKSVGTKLIKSHKQEYLVEKE